MSRYKTLFHNFTLNTKSTESYTTDSIIHLNFDELHIQQKIKKTHKEMKTTCKVEKAKKDDGVSNRRTAVRFNRIEGRSVEQKERTKCNLSSNHKQIHTIVFNVKQFLNK